MLDSSDEDSIGDLLLTINNAIQYGENLEPQEPKAQPLSLPDRLNAEGF